MHVGLHHAEKKRKEGIDDRFDRIMIFVGLAGPLSLVPQVLKIWIDKDASGISLVSWILLVGVSSMWTWYGLARHSKALVTSNAVLIVLNLFVVIGAILY